MYDTSKKKFEKIKSLSGCTRCSFLNHPTGDCKFNFRTNCQNCGKLHQTYLCMKDSASSKEKSASSKDGSKSAIFSVSTVPSEATISAACSGAGYTVDSNSIILPTFTADVCGPSDTKQVRFFRDGGCQRSFCERSLANQMNLRILQDNVHITIDGFNDSRNISTKIVSLPIEIAGIKHEISAICLDKIRTSFYAKNISNIARSFAQKGYSLADKWLINNHDDMVSNIGVVLGTDDDDVIPMTPILFGDSDRKSSFLDTAAGIVLSGNINRIQENLPYLPTRFGTSCSAVALRSVPFIGKTVNDSVDEPHAYTTVDKEFDEKYETSMIQDELRNLDVDLNEVLDIADISDENDRMSKINASLVRDTLENTSRDSSGRLVVPLLWNPTNSHLLAKNFYLSKQLLNSTYKKLAKEPLKLEMYGKRF